MTITVDDIILEFKEDADRVLETMCQRLKDVGLVTLNDLKILVSLPIDYTGANQGWDNLDESTIKQVDDGWSLELPPLRWLN